MYVVMYIYVHVCAKYVFMCVCVYTDIYEEEHIARQLLSLYMFKLDVIARYVCMCVCVYVYICTCVCKIYMNVYVCMYACMHVCMYV